MRSPALKPYWSRYFVALFGLMPGGSIIEAFKAPFDRKGSPAQHQWLCLEGSGRFRSTCTGVAHIRALMLQALVQSTAALNKLESSNLADSGRVQVFRSSRLDGEAATESAGLRFR